MKEPIWKTEGDDETFEYKGLECRILRISHAGHLCGYVECPPAHPWHGKHYGEYDDNVDVHGGVTFADKFSKGDDKWFIGFDCAHAGDYMPEVSLHKQGLFSDGARETYKDKVYVRKEIEKLADQILAKQPQEV